MKDTMAIVFAYQREEQMNVLTQKRSLPSVPFGGRYRVIDFTLSNIVNSGITKVGVITRDNYQSLIDHIGGGKEWDLNRKRDGLFIIPPFSNRADRPDAEIYRGKMEALLNAEAFIRRSNQEYVVLTTADCICNMTFDAALEFHRKRNADITVIYQKGEFERSSNPSDSSCFLTTASDGRVTDVAINPIIGREKMATGALIIGKSLLETLIWECNSKNEFSLNRDVLQKHVEDLKIYGWEYSGLFMRINSMPSYFDANMALLDEKTRDALFYQENKIYTKIRDDMPTLYFEGSEVKNSLVADGCIIEGTVENSIIARGVRIRKGATVKNCILMQSCEIQAGSTLEYIIADKDVVVRENSKLIRHELYPMVIAKGTVV